jgi:hypothetical protein
MLSRQPIGCCGLDRRGLTLIQRALNTVTIDFVKSLGIEQQLQQHGRFLGCQLVAVSLELGDDFALVRNMLAGLRDVTLGSLQVFQKHVLVHGPILCPTNAW